MKKLLFFLWFVVGSAFAEQFEVNIDRAARTLQFEGENASYVMKVSVGSESSPTPTGCFTPDRVSPLTSAAATGMTSAVSTYVIYNEDNDKFIQGTSQTDLVGVESTRGPIIMSIVDAKILYDQILARGLRNTLICIQ